ncbi:hypothetical protein [Streptomyces sp. NPDC086989]|uniref:hypothetical protein n=1 Tax=Streptomyces sp. NPDC086989 TaxID=3365764 RepID=UPI0037F2B72E
MVYAFLDIMEGLVELTARKGDKSVEAVIAGIREWEGRVQDRRDRAADGTPLGTQEDRR